jgi:hypothetical protein
VKERGDHSAEALSHLSNLTDRMHALLVARADELVARVEGAQKRLSWQR